jgi:hypothetical protein
MLSFLLVSVSSHVQDRSLDVAFRVDTMKTHDFSICAKCHVGSFLCSDCTTLETDFRLLSVEEVDRCTSQGPPPPPHLSQQQQPPEPPQQHPVVRELRVEDAFMYLDDVKTEFKDRPLIYNEFLGLLTQFRLQEVDKPVLIAKITKLFRGYNNLILGFNVFVPDGYKITLSDLERQEAESQAQEQA